MHNFFFFFFFAFTERDVADGNISYSLNTNSMNELLFFKVKGGVATPFLEKIALIYDG